VFVFEYLKKKKKCKKKIIKKSNKMVILLEQAIHAHVALADGISGKHHSLKVDITKKTSKQKRFIHFENARACQSFS